MKTIIAILLFTSQAFATSQIEQEIMLEIYCLETNNCAEEEYETVSAQDIAELLDVSNMKERVIATEEESDEDYN